MQSTPNPNQTEPDDLLVIAPDIVLVARADKAHDAIGRPSDSQTHMAPDFSAGPSVLPVDTTFRAAAVNDVRVRGDRRSIGGRAIRACIGFLLAVCLAVAASLWQSYGDAAKQIVARWVPQFALTSSSPQDNPGLPAQPGPAPVQASAAKAVPPAQTAPEGVASAGATLSPESTQLLQSMAGDLAHAEQEIEQLKASIAELKASQQQMSRDTAKVSEARVSEARVSGARASEARIAEAKVSEQNLRSRLSAAVRRSAVASARKPMPPVPLPQAAAAPPLPQATAQPQAELAPRPPMPLR
jgi:hypothetical protein